MIELVEVSQLVPLYLSSEQMARMISSLNKADHIHLLELLGPEKSASIISKISDLGAANMVAQLTSEQAAAIVNELPHQLQVSIFRKRKKND
ncbi:MAG: hypothetical protein OET21_18565 [Desulfobacterales bacterium]|nr:hypothetical protein [Desulfobacterales bacterium]MDH3829436.1 hypothetical protein [Desulfobacterales bacterium]MDH4009532.1 hypothetical protein [Desulfobacterales bacterium]